MKLTRIAWSLALLSMHLGSPAGFAGTDADQEVVWSLDPPDCLPAPGVPVLEAPCGDRGMYHLYRALDLGGGDAPSLWCRRAGPRGREIPPLYPPPKGADALRTREALAAASLGESTAGASSWAPCENGACFTSLANLHPGLPWVAEVDWFNLHGRSIGWTLKQLLPAATPVVLFPLDDARLEMFSRYGVTDVHVLHQLCAIAEAVDAGRVEPPLAVNLSFGRRLRATDPRVPGACPAPALGCEIGAVLDHLATPYTGSYLVAAAGNHRSPSFPAAHVSTLQAGGLDWAAFELDGSLASSWETPPMASLRMQALFPAQGLCLEDPAAAPGLGWTPPAGTSYSAALGTAWLAGLRLQQPGDWWFGDGTTWGPRRICADGDCVWRLIIGDEEFSAPTEALGEMLERASPSAGETCEGGSADARLYLTLATAAVGVEVLPAESLVDLVDRTHRPAPDADPCVPCDAVLKPKPPRLARSSSRALGDDLEIDVSRSFRFTTPVTLEALFLRRGSLLWQVQLPPENALMLASGQISHLVLSRAGDLVDVEEQLSLVYVLRPATGTPREPYWSSTPILVRDP